MSSIKMRSMFIAPPKHQLVQFDFSQAESWVVAFLANEPNMKRALMYGDIHSETAGVIFRNTGCEHSWKKKLCLKCGTELLESERYSGKRVNHASAYRMKAPKLVQVINKDSDKPPYVTITAAEGKHYMETWHGYYQVKGWWADIEQKLSQTRTMITTYGRRRVFYGAWGEELFREATAFEPQSTVADHANGRTHPELGIKGGFLEVYNRFHHVCKIVNQAHDSIILEIPSSLVDSIVPEIYFLLRRPLVIKGEQFTIPVDCEIGERWGELEKKAIA